MKYLYIFSIFLFCFSFNSKANNIKSSITLTCDFTAKAYHVIVDYPSGCSSKINNLKAINNNSIYFLHLPPEILFLAEPPLCPEGYTDLNIEQGGRISSGHANNTFSYQVRRICVIQ